MSGKRRIAATSIAILGWMVACTAIAGIVSLWYAVKLALAPEPYTTPEAWVIGRAVLFGLPVAILPVFAYLWFARATHADAGSSALVFRSSANNPMQPSGEVTRLELGDQPSPPSDR